jgi:hypothetical protein
MTRLEKVELLKSKGYTYDKETGKIYNKKGIEIISKSNGYIILSVHNHFRTLVGHHFAWYMTYDNVEFEMLDHINRIRHDNRICNLRIVNNQKNLFNTSAKGYYHHKKANKWVSMICVDYKQLYLGIYDTEEEARQVYIEAKKKYHKL